ncbi:MAG TPA: serine hydrolase domain-containing protein [Verrucomicrobiae bacterium]|nr:serine hydrolase domain-containing protein [Verrucomicrobiae bacterium]
MPRDIGRVVTIDRAAETDPKDVGLDPRRVEAIWTAVEDLYRTGLQPAMTMVVRREGKIVLKRAIGCISGNAPGDDRPPVPLSPDTPISLFSASKAISALLVHKLVELNQLSLDDRVAEHIPKFAQRGKGKVTVRQLMAHRAGIPLLPIKDPDPDLLKHWDAIVDMLCAAAPADMKFQKQAYHALTAGFLIGELVRRVSGRDLRELLKEWIADPLQAKHLTYGLAPALRDQAPVNVFTGPKAFWPINTFARRILGVTFEGAVEASNSDAFLSGVVPAGNIYATADEASRVFQMLHDHGKWNGQQVFEDRTVAEAIRPVGPLQIDSMLRIPIRYSAGFMLGENPFGLYGPRCAQAFGHLGFIAVLCWADRSRGISVSFLNTGKSVAPSGVLRLARVLGAISRACPPLT